MWYIRARVQQGKRTHTNLDCFYSWTLEADLLSKTATFHWRLSFIAQIWFWILKGKYAFPHYSFIMYMKVETPKSLWNGRTMWLHKYSYSAYIRFEGNRLFWNNLKQWYHPVELLSSAFFIHETLAIVNDVLVSKLDHYVLVSKLSQRMIRLFQRVILIWVLVLQHPDWRSTLYIFDVTSKTQNISAQKCLSS